MATSSQSTAHVAAGENVTADAFTTRNLQATQMSEVMIAVPSLVQRGIIYLISAILVAGLGFLYFGKVHVIVTAKGTVVPQGEGLRVEAADGGTVTEVLARVGQHLPAGAPIIRLDPTRSDMSLGALTRKLQLLQNQLEGQRATALVVERCLANPEGFLGQEEHLDISGNIGPLFDTLNTAWLSLQRATVAREREFPQKKQALQQAMGLAQERMQTSEKSRQASLRDLGEADEGLNQKKKRLDEFRRLVERGIYAELDLEAETERYRSAQMAAEAIRQQVRNAELEISNERLRLTDLQHNIQTGELETAHASELALVQYRQSLANLRQGLQNLRLQIEKTDAETQNTSDELQVARRQLADTTITMPVAGTIIQVDFKNPGETIPSNGVVATVVADGEPLLINAMVANEDIGFVADGLSARVKVDAYPYRQFGTVPGSVLQVLPNVGQDENFKVTLALPQDKISYKTQAIQLFPGLTVEAEIITREDRLFWFLLRQHT